jgi:hypothetical protein
MPVKAGVIRAGARNTRRGAADTFTGVVFQDPVITAEAPLQPPISRLWHPGDRVRWRDRIGVFHRDVGDSEHAEIVIADRTYRVRVGDLA